MVMEYLTYRFGRFKTILATVLALYASSFLLKFGLQSPQQRDNSRSKKKIHHDLNQHLHENPWYCSYREYPARRYYGLIGNHNQRNGRMLQQQRYLEQKVEFENTRNMIGSAEVQEPDFLKYAKYIRGKKPVLLPIHRDLGKPCVNQSAWYDDEMEVWPFSDGTNPGLLFVPTLISTADDNRRQQKFQQTKRKNSSSNQNTAFSSWADFLSHWVQRNKKLGRKTMSSATPVFIMSIVFKYGGSSVCQWRDTPQEQEKYKLSKNTENEIAATVVSMVDHKLRSLAQFRIYLVEEEESNADGQHREKRSKLIGTVLDDPRLFLHNGEVWISFNIYLGFEQFSNHQLFAPLHLSPGNLYENDAVMNEPIQQMTKAQLSMFSYSSMVALVRINEIVPVCCGRNMGALEQKEPTSTITPRDSHHHFDIISHLDPVRVESISEKTTKTSQEYTTAEVKGTRKLEESSHFHGNNGFLPYIAEWDEYLGIGHFHRPGGNDGSIYAPYGHHYTHAFYTISAKPPYKLQRLSNEFVFPSKYFPRDADMVQFVTSLLVIPRGDLSSENSQTPQSVARKSQTTAANYDAIIAYGINDCESSIVKIGLDLVNSVLQKVKDNQQVLDFMLPNATKSGESPTLGEK